MTATSLVTDAAGTGLIIVGVDRSTEAPVDLEHCTGPHAKAQCRTGPNGEHIEIYDFGVEADGTHGITIYVYSGHTFILAGAHNAGETQNARPEPADTPVERGRAHRARDRTRAQAVPVAILPRAGSVHIGPGRSAVQPSPGDRWRAE